MAEKVLTSLYEWAEKTKKLLATHADKLTIVLFTLIFGLTPVGGFYPFGWAYFLTRDENDGISLAAICFCLAVTGGGLLGITVAIGLYAFKRLLPRNAPRPLAKAIAGTVAAAFLCIAGLQNGVYGLAQGIASMSLVPIFCFLYGLYLTPTKNSGSSTKQAGLASLLFTLCLFLHGVLPWEAPVIIFVLIVTVLAAREGGMLCGGFFGFTLGLSCGAPCSAMAAICGLCTGLLFSVGGAIAVSVGCLAGLCTGLYFYGSGDMPRIILCFLLAGVCYFIFGSALRLLPEDNEKKGKVVQKADAPPFAKVFSELSHSARIAAGNNESAARAADDYANFSTLLMSAKLREEREVDEDEELSSAAAVVMRGAGLHPERIKVSGGRRKHVEAEGIAIDRLSLSSEQLKALLGQIIGSKMKQPEFVLKNGKATLYMESAPRYRIECSRTGVNKKGEKLSGDTVSFFSGNGYFYSLISDGMGSGKEAAVSSRLAGVFLEKLLLAGADRYSTLSLLNGYLASRDSEVFATVDLLEADLYTGKAVLVQAGAAPSLLLRDGRCKRLELASPPAGIIRELGAKQLSFELKEGDVLVMFSDGICGDGDGEETAAALVSLSTELSTATVASNLLAEAVKRTGKTDDMSLCVIKILAA